MLESSVESALVRGVKRHKPAFTMKGERLGKGWPDRIVFASKGRIAFIELKRPGGILARRQNLIGKLLRRLGFEWQCLWTHKAVEEWLVEFFGDEL